MSGTRACTSTLVICMTWPASLARYSASMYSSGTTPLTPSRFWHSSLAHTEHTTR